MLVGRLLRILSIVILAVLLIVVAAVFGLSLYEPSLAEGFVFSSAEYSQGRGRESNLFTRSSYQVSLKGRTSTSNDHADLGCVARWYTVSAISLGLK